MKLHIKPTNLISEVQHEFNSHFPFLRLEFYQKHLTGQRDFGPGAIMPHNRKIGDCQTALTEGVLDMRLTHVIDLLALAVTAVLLLLPNATVFQKMAWLVGGAAVQLCNII